MMAIRAILTIFLTACAAGPVLAAEAPVGADGLIDQGVLELSVPEVDPAHRDAMCESPGQMVEWWAVMLWYRVREGDVTRVGMVWEVLIVESFRGGVRAWRGAGWMEVGYLHGRRLDRETGLYYLRNRYYDPERGRWISRDPKGLWGDASQLGNGYGFVGANAINGLDPFGLQAYLRDTGVRPQDPDFAPPIPIGYAVVMGWKESGRIDWRGIGEGICDSVRGAMIKAEVMEETLREDTWCPGGVSHVVAGQYFGFQFLGLSQICEGIIGVDIDTEGVELESLTSTRDATTVSLTASQRAWKIVGGTVNFAMWASMARYAKVPKGGGGALSGARYRIGEPIPAETSLEFALLGAEEKAAFVVKKYGMKLRGSGKNLTLHYDEALPFATTGKVQASNPTVIRFGKGSLVSETELARTIAHEIRHARAYLGSGSNTEAAARASENAIFEWISGMR